ncbi:hypothetical protein Asphe3_10100 [Pseudarthrobacter phenanthrenivorans Sphe3]|uniref:Uncharacterized protein n=1 Tax=Pseudarthrobacter phenanthrenivorans (strain DSM 18606 / JCM 16027 / LMG 23796 / Sphe3) TaxID=930171 RepID=F0M3H6_PSEPM|nr:hypothetical protein [Pseudarthrobacter phenanthrenivorans]ADX72195.1 hypothetical protein Asphe3_10100 [Pseudarthrobacter phenanthrenivorans Sphe3]
MVAAISMILPLNRPQYVSVPEAFISSLAWRVYDHGTKEISENGVPVGYMFRSETSGTSTLKVKSTAPEGEDLGDFGHQLVAYGLATNAKHEIDVARAVLNSVAGVQAEKSKSQAASPITPAFALLQDMRGFQRTKNPPDLGGILEGLFRLGLQDGSGTTAAGLWLSAANKRCEIDPLLSAIDKATKAALLGGGYPERIEEADLRWAGAAPGSQEGLYEGTPFSWFAKAWQKLTGDEWVKALPARVWVDWATTVLRLALGQGFLWEAAWYETLARWVLSGKRGEWSDVRARVPEILPWKSSRSSVAVRDVAPLLSWRVHRGSKIRKIFEEWLASNSVAQVDFSTALAAMSADEELKGLLTLALGSAERSAANTWEAVRYALLTRDASGPFADYYGLLRSNGRFLTVQPGTEWMAVVASLACEGPGRTSDVATLMLSLEELGLRPEAGDLIQLLEKAGLARGSADADRGVIIESAF